MEMETETGEFDHRFQDAFQRSCPDHDRRSDCSADYDRCHRSDDASGYYRDEPGPGEGDHPRRLSSREKAWRSWRLDDAEMSRRRRVVSYKAYAAEGRMKASFRKGFRWIKVKCTKLVHGC